MILYFIILVKLVPCPTLPSPTKKWSSLMPMEFILHRASACIFNFGFHSDNSTSVTKAPQNRC